MINSDEIRKMHGEMKTHLTDELLPFWMSRCRDEKNGGFITHFNEAGEDSGEDEKSLIAQTRMVYSLSLAHRYGYGNGDCADLAAAGVDYLLDRMWDAEYGGFYWMTDRQGRVTEDRKILYGQSFAIYALSEYTRSTGDGRGLEWAEKTFNLLQIYAAETSRGGYWEMFGRDWTLAGPGSAGGDRKTLDAHMHLMEAFTALYQVGGREVHRRKLREIMDILLERIIHPDFGTGTPQFFRDWSTAPQIKFDIIWGWDRFQKGEVKKNAENNCSYGHDVEFAWLFMEALRALGEKPEAYSDILLRTLHHSIDHGVDWDCGGVYVEGERGGEATDLCKEFWQQAEFMTGMLDAWLVFRESQFLDVYKNVHRFVLDRMINHPVGEWYPLMERDGTPVWRHMSHSWKVSYHTVRAAVQAVERLEKVIDVLNGKEIY